MTAEQINRLDIAFRRANQLTGQPIDELINLVVSTFTGSWEDDDVAGRKKVTPKPVEVPADNMEKIQRWFTIKPQLAALQAEEHALRQAIVSNMFDNTKLEGTEAIDIGSGWILKSVKSQNVTATNKGSVCTPLLDYVKALDPTLSAELFDWKPDVHIKPFRKLIELAEAYPDLKSMLSLIFTVKPGMPELDLLPPAPPAPVIEDGAFPDGEGQSA